MVVGFSLYGYVEFNKLTVKYIENLIYCGVSLKRQKEFENYNDLT